MKRNSVESAAFVLTRAMAAFWLVISIPSAESKTILSVLSSSRLARLTDFTLVLGVVSLVAGGNVPGHEDGAGDKARFREPRGLLCSKSGYMLVADTGNHCIRHITFGADAAACTVKTIAGSGTGRIAGVAPLLKAAIMSPKAMAFDVSSEFVVYVAGSSLIRRVDFQSGTLLSVLLFRCPYDSILSLGVPLSI